MNPTDLDLSPSKARAHSLASTAWSQVTTWLHSLLPPNTTLPTFERHPDVLAYLQSLMHANLFANNTRHLLHTAQEAQLAQYERHRSSKQDSPAQRLADEITLSLTSDGAAALDALASTSITLGYLPPTPTQLSPAPNSPSAQPSLTHQLALRLCSQTRTLFTLQNQLHSLDNLYHHFNQDLERTKLAGINATESDAGHAGSHDDDGSADQETETSIDALRTRTNELQMSTKHLNLKLDEYYKRTSALDAQWTSLIGDADEGHVTYENVRHRSKQLQQKRQEVRELEEKLKVYHALPPDVEASREEVSRAQTELETLKRKRADLFGKMGRR